MSSESHLQLSYLLIYQLSFVPKTFSHLYGKFTKFLEVLFFSYVLNAHHTLLRYALFTEPKICDSTNLSRNPTPHRPHLFRPLDSKSGDGVDASKYRSTPSCHVRTGRTRILYLMDPSFGLDKIRDPV